MFWLGLATGIIFYAIVIFIGAIIGAKKKKKANQKKQDYQYIINGEIEKNKQSNNKSQ